ncbi:MAG: hypothetical protein QNL61_03525 [Crocinitomicaceae bacterium]
MIQGAIIGAVVGLVIYFMQKSKEKKTKENYRLDDHLLNKK